MNGGNMFGTRKYQNWLAFYPKIRKDLIFVMDDSWDIPLNVNAADNKYLGLAEIDQTRFPQFQGTALARMKNMVTAVKARGRKGLGGWLCAQKSELHRGEGEEHYWISKLQQANNSGFAYWKVDWGKQSHNGTWREMLTRLGKKYARGLVIEHAINELFIGFSDACRTYDVENIIAQPTTIDRISHLLKQKAADGAKGIINCEDEPYIAAGTGSAIGVMRHPFDGNLPNGAIDFVFPPAGRNIKKRLDEVVRGVRWHRIAVPFAAGSTVDFVDSLYMATLVFLPLGLPATDHFWTDAPADWSSKRPGAANLLRKITR